jgi:Fic family protein
VKEENASTDIKEVIRYREALWKGYNLIKEKGGITTDMIISVYQKIKNSNQGFRSPQSQVVIRRGNSELLPGEIIYTPPQGKGVLGPYIDNLVAFLSNNTSYKQDPLLKMAIAHYQFEAIHPFSDGNGRTGRIINLLYLADQGLLSQPILYLSKFIIENKNDYYLRLSGVTQLGDWKHWLLFMLEAVRQTALITNRLIDEIVSQMASTLEYGKGSLKWYTKEVNEALFSQPYIKPAILGNILKRTSRTTLTRYMKELTTLGILSPIEDGKEVYYLNNDLIRILEG